MPTAPERLKLYYEAQPFRLNQGWGVPGEIYKQFGFKRHNGLDIAHGYNSRVRAPFPYIVYRTLWQPEGGGLVLSIVSKDEWRFDDGKSAHVLIDYLHLEKYVKTQGSGGIGDLLAIAGNTGAASTGPHTHIQARRVRRNGSDWKDIDRNDANNSFDQRPYYTGIHAVDYVPPEEPVSLEMVSEVLEAAQASLSAPIPPPEPVLSLWARVLEVLSRLLTKG